MTGPNGNRPSVRRVAEPGTTPQPTAPPDAAPAQATHVALSIKTFNAALNTLQKLPYDEVAVLMNELQQVKAIHIEG